jgi:hypothetical protein
MKDIIKYALLAGGVVAIGVGAGGLVYYFTNFPKEVFYAWPPSGEVDPTKAVAVAKEVGTFGLWGTRIATKDQLLAAQKAGANWCGSGWIAESDGKTVKDAQYPMQDMPIDPDTNAPVTGCGDAFTVNTCNPPTCKIGVVVYGKKPAKGSKKAVAYNVRPWDNLQWNK